MLQAWWTRRGQPPIPEGCLPPTGIVAEADGTILSFGFLVKSDTISASIVSLCGNPEVSKEVRGDALESVIHALILIAETSGFKILVAGTSNVPSLEARFKEMGFDLIMQNLNVYGGNL